MEQGDRVKEIKTAMNARMILLVAGLFLLMNAVTTTGRNALSWIGLSNVVEEAIANGEVSWDAEEPVPVEEDQTAVKTAADITAEEKSETEADTAAETEDKTAAETAAETEDKEAGTPVKDQAEAGTAVEAEDKAAEGTAAVTENETETETTAETEDKAETETTAETEGKAETETAAEAEDQADAAVETEDEAEADTEDQAVSETAASQEGSDTQDGSQEFDIKSLVRNMKALGVTAADFRLLGIVGVIAALLEAVCGLLCAINSNRVDRSKITLATVIVLLAGEAVQLVILLLKKALMFGTLFNALLLPLALLWGALKMRKLAKADPARVYAVLSAGRRSAQPAKAPAPKKSLRERAMMDTHTDPDEDQSDS